MTTISDLPRDLVEEIVSRVPLKFRRAVRLTCKRWDALFQSRSFTRMNFARESEESRMIVMWDYSIHLMSVVVDENPSVKSLGKLKPKINKKSIGKLIFLDDSEQVMISQFFHCEGLLLLCILKNNDFYDIWKADNTKIVVWNPYLGQTRWIKTSNNYCSRKVFDTYKYALGYENKSGNPKILRFIDDFYLHPENPAFLYEIYDFESDLWTSLDVCPEWDMMSSRGVSLKRNTYWGVREREAFTPTTHIICFDFTSERFGPLLPLPFTAFPEFASLEEKLVALFQTSDTYKLEIWITTKVEPTQVSWSYFFTMNIPSCLGRRLTYRMSFLVDEEKKVVMFFDKQGTTVCDLTHGRAHLIESFSKLVLEEPFHDMCWPVVCWPIVCSYVPSLVQIKRGKRKTQTD